MTKPRKTRKRAPKREFGHLVQKGKRFYVDYPAPDGRTETPGHSFASRLDAEGWLAAERRLIDLGIWTPVAQRRAEQKRAAMTVGQWLDQFHDSLNVRASTMQTYRNTTKNRITAPLPPGDEDPRVTRLKDISLGTLTKADVYEWWDGISRAYDTPETNRKAYTRLKAALDEALRRELIDRNPVEIRAAKRKIQPKTPYLPRTEELHAIVTAMRPRYKLFTALCLFHGLRIGEAIALEAEDVIIADLPVPYAPRYSIRVKQNAQRITPDGGRTYMLLQEPKTQAAFREVPFMPSMVPILWEHLAKHIGAPVTLPVSRELGGGKRQTRLLTTTSEGRILWDTNFREVLARTVEIAGVDERIKPHSGRRWLVTHLAESGAHVKEIARIVGDNDLDTIMKIYMQVRVERTSELMDMLDVTLVSKSEPAKESKSSEKAE